MSRRHLAPCVARRTQPSLLVAVVALSLAACRSTAAPERSTPSSEPEHFNFALPTSFERLELRGEGSEALRAPPGARVTPSSHGFDVAAGNDFALTIIENAPPLRELAPASVARVFSEPDLAVFKSERGTYSFVATRELVPEWDDGAPQRFACGSAGGAVSGAATGADVRGFSKPALESMVAACRSLVLPALE